MNYVKTGVKGARVIIWQKAVNNVLKETKLIRLDTDGIFGPKTLKATIAVQRYVGTKPDGVVGPKTVAAFKKKFPHVSLELYFNNANTFKVNTSGTGFKLPTPKVPVMTPIKKPKSPILIIGAIAAGIYAKTKGMF